MYKLFLLNDYYIRESDNQKLPSCINRSNVNYIARFNAIDKMSGLNASYVGTSISLKFINNKFLSHISYSACMLPKELIFHELTFEYYNIANLYFKYTTANNILSKIIVSEYNVCKNFFIFSPLSYILYTSFPFILNASCKYNQSDDLILCYIVTF